jgi:hypothetical protein
MPIFSSLLLDPTGHASTLASGVVEKPQEIDESFPLVRQWGRLWLFLLGL